MQISTKGRYALRLFTDLAEHRNGKYIALKEIAERQSISKKYLEQIIPLFNNTDMLKVNRGSTGGYMLARDPSSYTVYDILRITEGSLAPVRCAGCNVIDCERSETCKVRYVWQGFYDVIHDYLSGITLQDIIDK